jgi:hypothetical protein
MREQLVRYQHLTPFCRFVIALASGSRIHVSEPGQLGHFDDQKVQYTDARGRSHVDRLPRDCGHRV